MRWYRARDGSRRLWLDPSEIETMMEEELYKARLMSTGDELVTDIERFIERHLRAALDQHAELPASVLGVTHFFSDTPPRISVNRDLTGSALDELDAHVGAIGRWRATLAHEAAHVVIHRVLFEMDGSQGQLFGANGRRDEASEQQIRCLKREVSFAAGGDWREVQANRGMAALLMPRRTFLVATQQERERIGAQHPTELGSEEHQMLARRLAGRFQVSRRAAAIRLETLEQVRGAGQGAFP